MMIKIFGDKKIIIRKLSKEDLRNAKKFQDFINALVKEGAQITVIKKKILEEEVDWLKSHLKKTKDAKGVFLMAEAENKLVGNTEITLNEGRQSHIGMLGISIRKDYRGIGLGKYLMKEILKLAKKELKPKPKIIRLSVFPTNKPAIGLYKKFGFKAVATIPKQIQYKGKLIDEIVMLKEL